MVEMEVNTTMVRQVDAQLTALAENMDAMFLLFNAIIVSLMQAGFACLEAGCVHSKNVTSIILKNVLDMFLCAIVYWLIGYSLSYGPGNAFIGLGQWAGAGVPEAGMAHWFFQFVFAATAATILSGAVAERCNFAAYIVYSVVIGGFVYPVVAHWVWSEQGFLAELGYRDFAGSGAVHAMAGVCSFIAASIIGPRIGRYRDGALVDMPGHSTPLTGLGGLLLVSGFLAFNGGSLGHISHPGDGDIVARSITNTILGGSGAGVVILALSRTGLLIGKPCWAFGITLNAVLAGMVSVCAGVDRYTSAAAIVCGAVACFVYLLLRTLVLYLRVDDPLEAVAVHFGGGIWGVIAAPLFADGGIVYGITDKSLLLLWHNVLGGAVIVAWSAVCSLILFGILRLIGQLRVSEEEELKGLDISKHNEPGYPSEAWTTNSKEPQVHNYQTYHKNGSYTLEVLGGQPMAFDNMGLDMSDNRQRTR